MGSAVLLCYVKTMSLYLRSLTLNFWLRLYCDYCYCHNFAGFDYISSMFMTFIMEMLTLSDQC